MPADADEAIQAKATEVAEILPDHMKARFIVQMVEQSPKMGDMAGIGRAGAAVVYRAPMPEGVP